MELRKLYKKSLQAEEKFAYYVYKRLNKAKLLPPPPHLIDNELITDRRLYKTKYGDKFWLNNFSCIDTNIRDTSIWEESSTKVVKNLLKHGDIVLDIGANIGYYTVIMSRFVGQDGRILSFEPTEEYRNILKLNIETNNIKNVSVYDFGLSDKEWEAEIGIGDSSATMHWVGGTPQKTEKIVLKPLDNIIESLNLEKIDFIKIDVDGHEPAFLKGAWNTIERYKPTILLEISHANYLKAGVYAWDFFHDLRQRGFHIYSEKDMKEYSDVDTFLFDCGNFNKSANIIIKK